MFKGFQEVKFEQQVSIGTSNMFALTPTLTTTLSASTPVMDGLINWWNPAANVTTVGTAVSVWVDSVGSLSATQTTAGFRPTYTQETLGSVKNTPYVTAVGGRRYVENYSSGLTIGTSSGWTLMIISYDDGVQWQTSNQVGLHAGATNAITAGAYAIASTSGGRDVRRFDFFDSTARTITLSSLITSINSPTVSALVINRADGFMTAYTYNTYGYRKSSTAIDANTNNLGNPGGFFIGAQSTSATYSDNLRIGDVLIYNRALTDAEILQNQKFYIDKYGL